MLRQNKEKKEKGLTKEALLRQETETIKTFIRHFSKNKLKIIEIN